MMMRLADMNTFIQIQLNLRSVTSKPLPEFTLFIQIIKDVYEKYTRKTKIPKEEKIKINKKRIDNFITFYTLISVSFL